MKMFSVFPPTRLLEQFIQFYAQHSSCKVALFKESQPDDAVKKVYLAKWLYLNSLH